MSFADLTDTQSLSRPGWNIVDVFREVGIFSLVIVVVAFALISFPHHTNESTSQAELACASLKGLSSVNLDEVGPWVSEGDTLRPLFSSKEGKAHLLELLSNSLQSQGIKLTHDSSAPSLKLLLVYADQEYAIRGPRTLKSIELNLLENVNLLRTEPTSAQLTTWSRSSSCNGCTIADLEPLAMQLLNGFSGQVKASNPKTSRDEPAIHASVPASIGTRRPVQ